LKLDHDITYTTRCMTEDRQSAKIVERQRCETMWTSY